MRSARAILLWTGLVLLLSLSTGPDAAGAAGNPRRPARLAIGPFFAPGTHPEWEEESRSLRELVLVRLSAASRFELVDRDDVNRACDELQMSAAGLATRDQVSRLGTLLQCERFVSASIAALDGRRHLWIKVIDARNGVVLDLQPSTYSPGQIAQAADGIATFILASADATARRQFAALGPFHEMSPVPSARREDWSRRLAPLIERHLAAANIGIVELQAAGMLFEERRMHEAGLTARPDSSPVTLQPAFWLIDGGAGWMDAPASSTPGDGNSLVVGLRIQRVGGPEQQFWLTNAPDTSGPALDQAIATALRRALQNTNRVVNARLNAEPDLFAARAREFAFKQSPFWPRARPAKTRWDQYKQLRDDWLRVNERQQAVTAAYQRTLLQDPDNAEARQQVGMAYLWEPGGARWSEGVAMLKEVAAGGHPVFAPRAKESLNNLEVIRRAAQEGPSKPPLPDDWASIQQAYAEEPDDPDSQFDYARHLLIHASADPGSAPRARAILQALIAGNDPRFVPKSKALLARLDDE